MAIKSGFSSEDLARMGPDPLTRRRMIAEAMLADASRQRKIDHPLQGMAQLAQALVGGLQQRKFDRAEAAGRNSASATMNELGAALAGPSAFPPAPPSGGGTPTDYPSQRVAQAFGDGDIRTGITQTAQSLGVDPLDLATAISYETGGTFDPTKKGPTTQWGQHKGLIQFGEPQAEKYGVDWSNPVGSQLGPQGAIAKYLTDTGVKPGMGLLDIYSAINAGGVGKYNASDANNGGAPGTVRDKVEQQMSGHRAKAEALLGGASQVASLDPKAAMAAALTGQNGQLPSRNIPDRPVAQVAQAADPYNSETLGATPIPQGGPDMQMLTQAMGNQWLNPAQRSLVESLIGQKMQANDPAARLDMEYKRAQIDALKAKGDNLPESVRALNIRAQMAGLKPGTPEYSKFMVSGGTGPQTVVNTGSNTSEFVKKSDEAAAKRMDEIVATGQTAPQTMADMQQLIDLGATIGTGQGANIKAKLGPYAQALGIDIANLGDIQAYEAITSRLAPQMRATGSGSSSDRDVSMFLQSLPNLRNMPQGNEIIANTMKAVAQNKINAADIASQAQRGDITWQEADKKIRELPNPYDLFKEFQKQGTKGGGKDSAPAQPKSDEEYNALPSGALFVDPDDGKTYRKP